MIHSNTRYPSIRALPRCTLLLAGVLALGFVAVAGAATWNNPAGGAWSNPANWDTGDVPDAPGESAVLPDLGGAYQVTLDINPAVVTKLSDRGSQQTVGVVTDVGLFLHRLAEALR